MCEKKTFLLNIFFMLCNYRYEDLKCMLDGNKDGLKLEAMKRIIGVCDCIYPFFNQESVTAINVTTSNIAHYCSHQCFILFISLFPLSMCIPIHIAY